MWSDWAAQHTLSRYCSRHREAYNGFWCRIHSLSKGILINIHFCWVRISWWLMSVNKMLCRLVAEKGIQNWTWIWNRSLVQHIFNICWLFLMLHLWQNCLCWDFVRTEDDSTLRHELLWTLCHTWCQEAGVILGKQTGPHSWRKNTVYGLDCYLITCSKHLCIMCA